MSGGVPPSIPPIYAPGYMKNINLHQYNIKAVSTGLAEKFAWPQQDSNLRPSQCFGLARFQGSSLAVASQIFQPAQCGLHSE